MVSFVSEIRMYADERVSSVRRRAAVDKYYFVMVILIIYVSDFVS